MSKGHFSYVKQDEEYGCGYACLEMVAGISFEDANEIKKYTKKGRNRGLKIGQMRKILRKAGDGTNQFITKRGDHLEIGDGISAKILGKQFKKRVCESETSLLIFVVYRSERGTAPKKHWILYDSGNSKIKDPEIGKQMDIDDYILSEIGKFQNLRFYQISRNSSK